VAAVPPAPAGHDMSPWVTAVWAMRARSEILAMVTIVTAMQLSKKGEGMCRGSLMGV